MKAASVTSGDLNQRGLFLVFGTNQQIQKTVFGKEIPPSSASTVLRMDTFGYDTDSIGEAQSKCVLRALRLAALAVQHQKVVVVCPGGTNRSSFLRCLIDIDRGLHTQEAWSKYGGTNEIDNLQALCCECHMKKSVLENKARGRIKEAILTIMKEQAETC